MKDTDFEHDSRAHSFWSEWQGAADRAGDPGTYNAIPLCFTHSGTFSTDPDTGKSVFVVTADLSADLLRVPLPDSAKAEGVLSFAFEPEPFSEAVAALSPDWDFVVNGGIKSDVEAIHASYFKKVN